MSSSVKPKRTGLVVFGARIVSIFTGMLFLIMVTRWLPPAQFGLWEVLLTLVAFSAYPVTFLTYWATREVARGTIVGKTTQAVNIIASAPGVAVFLIFAIVSSRLTGSDFTPFLLAVVLVPLTYWNQSTAALASGYNPSIGAYALLISEPTKLLAAYPLLFIFKLKIEGVILALALSYLVSSVVSSYMLRRVSADKIDLGHARKWLAAPQVPGLITFAYLLTVADTVAASYGQGGTSLAGYYQAAFQVGTIVSYATYLSVALYPLLLRDRSEKLTAELLEFSLLFAIPMCAGAIALAPQLLFLLSPAYTSSSPVLIVLSVSAIALLISTVLDQTLTGRVKADQDQEARTKRSLIGDLYFVPAVNMIFYGGYVVVVFLLGRLGSATSVASSQFPLYWAVAQLLTNVCLIIVKGSRAAGQVRLLPSRSLLYFLASAVVMGLLVGYLGPTILPTSLDLVSYGLRLALLVLAGALVYFGLLFVLDRKFRGYVHSFAGMVSTRVS